MADFVTNLWESVFTPGPTPTLLLATNATFAFLQLTLAALLAATWSMHFVILSFLCGGLWWSINWFADEVRQAQEKEEQEKQTTTEATKDGESGADDEGGDTETEDQVSKSVDFVPTPADKAIRERIINDIRKQGQATTAQSDSASTAQTSALQVPAAAAAPSFSGTDAPSHFRSNSDASRDASTDSEWEKVENER
ncbi:hypothetical protein AAFC00_006525 [Neodothiora populina]|uniref:Pkr1-domain-containing protein n=1 Tax=Neodothiora populina TaxID=2781224 RepID=A0ABR3PBI7_9PEZI